MKFLAIVLGLTAAVCTQRVSITSLSNQNKNLKFVLPEKCLQVNVQKKCVKCQNNFSVREGKCHAIVHPGPMYTTHPIHQDTSVADILFGKQGTEPPASNPNPSHQGSAATELGNLDLERTIHNWRPNQFKPQPMYTVHPIHQDTSVADILFGKQGTEPPASKSIQNNSQSLRRT